VKPNNIQRPISNLENLHHFQIPAKSLFLFPQNNKHYLFLLFFLIFFSLKILLVRPLSTESAQSQINHREEQQKKPPRRTELTRRKKWGWNQGTMNSWQASPTQFALLLVDLRKPRGCSSKKWSWGTSNLTLVNNALVLSTRLVRVSILWNLFLFLV